MNYPARRKRSAMRPSPPTVSNEIATRLLDHFDAARIDFDLLRRQRLTLCNVLNRLAGSDFTTGREDMDLTGILHLLDALQDAASDSGVWK